MSSINIQITEWHSQNEREISNNIDDDDDLDSNDIEKHSHPNVENLKIYMFGKTSDGKNASVIVNGFPCFFYLSLPAKWMINKKINKSRVKIFVNSLLDRLRNTDKEA